MNEEILLKQVPVETTEQRNVTCDELYALLSKNGTFFHSKVWLAETLSVEILKQQCQFFRFNIIVDNVGVLAVVSCFGIGEALIKYGGENG